MTQPSKDSSPSAAAPRRLNILVADDVADLQALISSWLEEAGHAVTRAANGRQVVERVTESAFDLVVTDIVMPDGDGWDAIAKVHSLRPKTPVLAISGGTREMPASAVLRVAQGAGAIGLLKKPFSRVDLLAAVARVTARKP
jgi:CheY-like chemotaxis protein